MQADDEAAKLQRNRPGECCGYRCLRIRERTLTFQWNDLASSEEYQHDLLITVIRARWRTPEGAQALAKYLQPGCGSTIPMLLNVLYFRVVLDVLDSPDWRNVNTPALLRIKADAYETWRSLSKASANEPELQDNALIPAYFARGADAARQRSITAYQELLRQIPNDGAALDHLHNLKANQDTHQRNWYCFGD